MLISKGAGAINMLIVPEFAFPYYQCLVYVSFSRKLTKVFCVLLSFSFLNYATTRINASVLFIYIVLTSYYKLNCKVVLELG